MNLIQFLLVKLAEEATETAIEANNLAKLSAKALRFGLSSDYRGQTNASMLLDKYSMLQLEAEDVKFSLYLLARLDPEMNAQVRERYGDIHTFYTAQELADQVSYRAERLAKHLPASAQNRAISGKDYQQLMGVLQSLIEVRTHVQALRA